MTSNTTKQSGQIAFGEFLAYLRANGFTIGVDQHLRLQRLLSSVEGSCAPDELKTLLCPIFAASRVEQQEFYRVFDQFFAIFRETEAPVVPVVPPVEPLPETTTPPRRRVFIYTVLVLLALTIAGWLGRERIRSLFAAAPTPTPTPVLTESPPPVASPTTITVVIPNSPTTTATSQTRDWVLDHAWRLRLVALLPPILLFALWQLWRWRRRRPVIEKA
ncbi:MAG: hypothetical protein ACRD82_06540, partial [Blastocatellia bacterium]